MVSRVLSAGLTTANYAFCLSTPALCLTAACALSTHVNSFVKNYPRPLKGVLVLSSAFVCKIVNHTTWKTALTASAVFHLCIGFVRKEKRGSWKVSSQIDIARNSQQNCVYAALEKNEQLKLRNDFFSWISKWLKNKTIRLPFKGFAWESLQLQTHKKGLIFSGYKNSSLLWKIWLLNDGRIECLEGLLNIDICIGLLLGQFMTIQDCFKNQAMNPKIYANRMGDVFDEWCTNIFTSNTLLREPVMLFNGAIGGPSNYITQQFEHGPDGPKVMFELNTIRSPDQAETLWECVVQNGGRPNSWILQSDWILHKADGNWYIQQRSNGPRTHLSQTFIDDENQEGSYVAAVAQLLLDSHTVLNFKDAGNYQVNGTPISD